MLPVINKNFSSQLIRKNKIIAIRIVGRYDRSYSRNSSCINEALVLVRNICVIDAKPVERFVVMCQARLAIDTHFFAMIHSVVPKKTIFVINQSVLLPVRVASKPASNILFDIV